MDGIACQRDDRGGGDEDTGRARPRARRRFGPRPDSAEPALDITVNCVLSLTKEASWGFYEFFGFCLGYPLFTIPDSSP